MSLRDSAEICVLQKNKENIVSDDDDGELGRESAEGGTFVVLPT